MRDIKYYKNLNYKMIFHYESEDKVYIVQFPELPGCVSHGKTAKEALKNAYRVKDEWLESAFEDNCIIPEPSLPLETNGRITLRIPKSIHQKITDRAEEEDISQNQLILAYIAEGLERANMKNSIEETLQKQAKEIIESIKSLQENTTISHNFPLSRGHNLPPTSSEDLNIILARKSFQLCVESANKESNIREEFKPKENTAISDSNNITGVDCPLNS